MGKLMSVSEVATLCGVKDPVVRNAIKTGKLKAVRSGWLYKVDEKYAREWGQARKCR